MRNYPTSDTTYAELAHYCLRISTSRGQLPRIYKKMLSKEPHKDRIEKYFQQVLSTMSFSNATKHI